MAKLPNNRGKTKCLSTYLFGSLQLKAIKRDNFQLPIAEEIFVDTHGAKYISKIDASNSFWQTPVDKDSSKLFP